MSMPRRIRSIGALTGATLLAALALWAPTRGGPGALPESAPAGPRLEQTALGPTGSGRPLDPVFTVRARLPDRPDSDGFFSPPLGRSFVHEIRYEQTDRFAGSVDAGPQDGALAMSLAGRMISQVVARDGLELILSVRFSGLRVQYAQGSRLADAALTNRVIEDLSRDALVRMDVYGRILGYRFSHEILAENRNWVRTLVSAFAAVVPAGAGAEWETEQPDTTGIARVSYAWMPSLESARREERPRLSRTKRSYVSVDSITEASSMPALDGTGDLLLDRVLEWVREATITESSGFELQGFGVRFEHTASGWLRLIRVAEQTVPHLALLEKNAPWEPTTGSAEAAAMAQLSERAVWKQRLEGASLESLLARIARALDVHGFDSREAYEALENLAWYTRLDPSAAEGLRVLLTESRLSDEVATLAVTALGQAGHLEAQMVLASLLHDPRLPEETRVACALSIFQLATPTDITAEALLALAQQPTGSLPLEGVGLLALGAVAGTYQGDIDTLGALLALEAQAAQQGNLDVWLAALGNSASPSVLAAIQRFTSNPDAQVRLSAVLALADIPTGAATQVLATRALEDISPFVRAAAAEAYAARIPAHRMGRIRTILRSDSHMEVREAIVAGLAGRSPSTPSARAVLEWIASNDPSAAIRRAAQDALALAD